MDNSIFDYKSNLIGGEFVATIGLNKPWIRYSKGNDGEENYYRDYYSSENVLLYCQDEVCRILDFDDNNVILSNENIWNEHSETFTIPNEQFLEDFSY